jgi:hypothetical protein
MFEEVLFLEFVNLWFFIFKVIDSHYHRLIILMKSLKLYTYLVNPLRVYFLFPTIRFFAVVNFIFITLFIISRLFLWVRNKSALKALLVLQVPWIIDYCICFLLPFYWLSAVTFRSLLLNCWSYLVSFKVLHWSIWNWLSWLDCSIIWQNLNLSHFLLDWLWDYRFIVNFSEFQPVIWWDWSHLMKRTSWF